MSYDADSFKAGFALGRLLWRPPVISDVDTGLGWTMPSEYAVRDAGTLLCTVDGSSRSPYSKRYNGIAACVILKNFTNSLGTWVGPILISTVEQNTYYLANGDDRILINSFLYDGLRFYVDRENHTSPVYGGGSQIPTSDFPVYDCAYMGLVTDHDAAYAQIMRGIGIRVIQQE